jgi:hypothetical protein
MAKTVHYNDDGSTERILDAYVANGRTDTATFQAAVEAEMVPRLSTTGSYDVNNAEELSGWVSNLVQYVFENSAMIKDQE